MPLDRFHPVVARWFAETLGDPTAAQRLGWAAIRERRHTLIAAPTGSGKTLAAFLTALDDLFQEGLGAPLPDEVRVVYVSPLKALSADIHKNLAEPRRGIHRLAVESGLTAPRITAAVRTGDTTQAERARMLQTPPHILVTTPESLYLLLTAERSRQMLRTARTVIVDEIHAVIGTRRGAHLALSLERLDEIAGAPMLRLGLSATQKPVDEVARFLVGTRSVDASGRPACAVVNEGHRREMDLGLEIPRSSLEAVMPHEVWEEYYDRLVELITQHRTTLVFVNTRRMTERTARHLSDRLGGQAVTAHHGSLSKEKRLDAEARLKSGQLKALVATASLELGIDIGVVDLVCQIGSPHRIATLLQRVGRAGHTVSGVPRGRLFPTSRDDLVECAALLRSVRRGELDAIVSHDAPVDVLAQQLVAETACREYAEDELFALVRRAWPYRGLDRSEFDAVLKMVADGFAARPTGGSARGRHAALLHRDEVHRTVRARRGARLLAITSGGAIPEVADYRVVLEPEDTFIGTLNEDFAIESMAGDIFQLGNASWQVLRVGAGVVRVADAKGAPPTIPFWLGEAPARSDELSRAVSDLRQAIASAESDRRAIEWTMSETGMTEPAAEQAVAYLTEARRILGVMPTQATLVLERFFDESGGMQLVLHAPFGSRINKAWGLALRKRFCRQFNFELQASATDDAVLLSLGPQHSFPLADVFRYLSPATVGDVLIQALLDAPVFQTRWRWNTTISLAVPRNRAGRKVPPQLQRMIAADLMAAAFPDAAACLENIPGDRQIPDHPLVRQTIRDCIDEAMDYDGLVAVLTRIHRGDITCAGRDTPEPSPLAHEILNARPYAFLDDAPLEERRTQAVYARRTGEATSAGDLGTLDGGAIDRVRDEERPDPRDAHELHDALMTAGFLTELEAADGAANLMTALTASCRATSVTIGGSAAAADATRLWIAAERLPELLGVHSGATMDPPIAPPATRSRTWTREEALVELLRSRLSMIGPATAEALARSLAVEERDVDDALHALESEGAILRGSFTPSARAMEWCDRRLLARIHRYTLSRLRAEIEPVSPADFMRFLFAWQHVDPSARLTGIDGLRAIVARLDGFELAARAWERSVLPARMDRYDPAMLDTLCLTGEVGWARLSTAPGLPEPVPTPRLVGATPIALFLHEHGDAWRTLRFAAERDREVPSREGTVAEPAVGEPAHGILETLRERGASFLRELEAACGLEPSRLHHAIGELVAAGLVTSDGFAGLRAMIRPPRPGSEKGAARGAGRWSAVPANPSPDRVEAAIEAQAWSLLRRYGIVFRRLLEREANAAPWRLLGRVYRRLEARGEIRGGRFVAGMSGEQFALGEAIARLREIRRGDRDGRPIAISAADPLNLAGIVIAGERVRASAATRIAFRDGIPVAVMEGDYVRPLAGIEPSAAAAVATALAGRRVPPVVSGYLGRTG
jgi:ATP-dependent Lhr-like helicase